MRISDVLWVASLGLFLIAMPSHALLAFGPEDRLGLLNKFSGLEDINTPQVHVDIAKPTDEAPQTGKGLQGTAQKSGEVIDDISRPESIGVIEGFWGTIRDWFKNLFDLGADWWERASSLGRKLQEYGNGLLNDACSSFPEIASKLDELKEAVHSIITQSRKFESDVAAVSMEQTHTIDWEAISKELGQKLQLVLGEIEAEFPPSDQAPGHKERQGTISRMLEKAEESLVMVGVKHGISEERLRSHFQTLRPHVETLIVVAGDVIEQHPTLFTTLAFSVVSIIVPESLLLRPILSLFGFSPYGPVKGSTAAWAQRRFFGAVIEKGSWFSYLQRAGMTITAKETSGGTAGVIVSTIRFTFGLLMDRR